MGNNAKNFMLLACVALQEGKSSEAAQLFVQANKMNDMQDFLREELAGNVEAQTLVESLSTSDEHLNSLSSDFTLSLEVAFGAKSIPSLSSDDEDEDDDLDLDILDDDDEEDEDEFESNSSATSGSLFRFKN